MSIKNILFSDIIRMPRRRTPTAIQVLNSALERVVIKETPSEPKADRMEGSGAKVVKPKSSIKLPKEKKAELINTRILLTR